MKRFLILILAFAMVTTFAACSTMEEKLLEAMAIIETATIETTEPIEETIPTTTEATEQVEMMLFATIEAKNCFYDAGFIEFIAGAEESAEYTFTAENSDATEWYVYVLDEAFDEGFRYIKQIAEPVLMGDGQVTVEDGQFVYVYCSANEFTTGVVDEHAKLNVYVK